MTFAQTLGMFEPLNEALIHDGMKEPNKYLPHWVKSKSLKKNAKSMFCVPSTMWDVTLKEDTEPNSALMDGGI